IYLDATDALLTPRALTHTYEPGVRSLLERLVKPGATVVEVGAGQGYHTLTLAALAGPGGGRVLAFEPNPRAAGFLRQPLLCNALEPVVSLWPAAAYHENRTLALYLGTQDSPLSASLLPTAGAATVQVDAVRVGDILAAEGLRADVVRLDVAGAEASA